VTSISPQAAGHFRSTSSSARIDASIRLVPFRALPPPPRAAAAHLHHPIAHHDPPACVREHIGLPRGLAPR